MKKKILVLLTAFLPMSAMAHPGHMEMNLTSAVEFMVVSAVCAYALHRVLSLAKEKLKR